jgi:hypothetical protein
MSCPPPKESTPTIVVLDEAEAERRALYLP